MDKHLTSLTFLWIDLQGFSCIIAKNLNAFLSPLLTHVPAKRNDLISIWIFVNPLKIYLINSK